MPLQILASVLLYISKAGFFHQLALRKEISTQKCFRFQMSKVWQTHKNASLLFNQNIYSTLELKHVVMHC